MGLAIKIGDVDWSSANLGKVTIIEPVYLMGLDISVGINVRDKVQLTPVYTPVNTTDIGVSWEIIEGSQYASISNSGELTVFATGTVKVKVTSTANNLISNTEDIAVECGGSNVILQVLNKQYGSTSDIDNTGLVMTGTVDNLNWTMFIDYRDWYPISHLSYMMFCGKPGVGLYGMLNVKYGNLVFGDDFAGEVSKRTAVPLPNGVGLSGKVGVRRNGSVFQYTLNGIDWITPPITTTLYDGTEVYPLSFGGLYTMSEPGTFFANRILITNNGYEDISGLF